MVIPRMLFGKLVMVLVPGIEAVWYDGVVAELDVDASVLSIKYKYPGYFGLCTAHVEFVELSQKVRNRDSTRTDTVIETPPTHTRRSGRTRVSTRLSGFNY